ncbi:hypothetical protein QFC19_000719 [Naganishia cerealis]|uniref:Uncharacterized protein n=1 Tax=Naganishia cerealis TaxID=610337 RepID=A0ACC2WKN2_9TREE|nr:hypothetical protein QFC19_000719 [Naganishia cerealis]
MKAVIQKVTNASVTVEGQVISSIGRGLMVLIGIGVALSAIRSDDTPKDREYIVRKILNTRLFDGPAPTAASDGVRDDELKERQKSLAWKASVKDIGGEVLCVSQFTLMAKVEKGSKPDGRFGAMMQVALCNDGPVTITIDSKAKPASTAQSCASTPLTSGTSTPVPDSKNVRQTLVEKKEKRAKAAEAFAQRKTLEASEQHLN